MKKTLILGALLLMTVLPAVANAQLGNLEELVNSFGNIIELLIPIVGAIALLYFFWGLAKFILASGDEEERGKGKHIMIWGIVALFVIVSVWGLVRWLQEALDLGTVPSNQSIPSVNR